MNKFLLVRISISFMLIASFLIKADSIIFNNRITTTDMLYFSINLINLMIIWIRKPFFWYLGLFIFLIGIYYTIEYEFLHLDSNTMPSIMSTKPIYYYFKELNVAKWIVDIVHYLPYLAYSIFFILFLTNCRIKKYYKISCNMNKKNTEFLDENF